MKRFWRWCMKTISYSAWAGVALPVARLEAMAQTDKKDYLSKAKELAESEVLFNEIQRLKNTAGIEIVRHTSTDELTAWFRGVTHGLESLEKRLKLLSEMSKKESKRSQK